MDKTMQDAFQKVLGEFVRSAPEAYYSVSSIADIQQSFFYCGAASAFQVVQFRAAEKVEAGTNLIQALMEALDEVAKEITDTARAHEAELLASLERLKKGEGIADDQA